MATIQVGSPAPAFSIFDAQGRRHALSDYRGRMVVLYFYPEDDTPLCTAQACQFRDHHPDFSKLGHGGCAIIGISPDDKQSHADFAAKHDLPFTLLTDEKDAAGNPKVCMLYGAWGEKNMYGNIVRGMLRTTYLIGPDGIVARRWDRVKTPGHAAQVLAAAKALHSGEGLSVFGEVKPIKKLSAAARKPAKKRTRTSHGNATRKSSPYSGVTAARGKKTAERAGGAKERAGRVKGRGR